MTAKRVCSIRTRAVKGDPPGMAQASIEETASVGAGEAARNEAAAAGVVAVEEEAEEAEEAVGVVEAAEAAAEVVEGVTSNHN